MDDDGKVRCRACYRERMEQAQRLITGVLITGVLITGIETIEETEGEEP